MPRQIELSDEIFARLQKHTVPLVDNIESVINKLVNFYEDGVPPRTQKILSSHEEMGERKCDPFSPPDLTHTKVLSIRLGNKEVVKPNWNRLIHELLCFGKHQLKQTENLRSLILINHVRGEKSDHGYQYVREIDLSVQGQDANAAWNAARHIAKQLKTPVRVKFLWPDDERAAFPGEQGVLEI